MQGSLYSVGDRTATAGRRTVKILVLSDISWRQTGLESLKKVVTYVSPSLVLLAGDLVDNDKSTNGNQNLWSSLYELVDFLDENRIRTFFIRGNWDRAPYDRLLDATRRLPHIEEISDRVAEFGGVRILGIPFSSTEYLRNCKRIGERFPEPVDIVLAHAELVRRIWLFELKTKFVITGHYDSQVAQIRDKVFVSLGGFPSDLAIVDYEETRQTVTYVERKFVQVMSSGNFVQEVEVRVSRAEFVASSLTWGTDPTESPSVGSRHRDYATWVERLLTAKEQVSVGTRKRGQVVQELWESGIPRNTFRSTLAVLTF